VIAARELYCCLLPQCEALRTCRSGFSDCNTSPLYMSLKKIECNNSMSSVVIEVKVITVTKIYFLNYRLSASFRYPLLFRNETLLRSCLFIIKAESCAQHMIRGSVQIQICTLNRLLIIWSGLALLGIVVLKVRTLCVALVFINQACKNRATFWHQW